MGRLDDRVIVITGSGRGIGAGLARTCAAQGAKVVVNDLGGAVDGIGSDQTPAQAVVDEIAAAGGQAVANYADVSDYDQAEALVKQALDTYGGLDVLINVAGILRDQNVIDLKMLSSLDRRFMDKKTVEHSGNTPMIISWMDGLSDVESPPDLNGPQKDVDKGDEDVVHVSKH